MQKYISQAFTEALSSYKSGKQEGGASIITKIHEITLMKIVELQSNRLKLRQWKDSDLITFAKLSADQEVMRFYPSTLNKNESDDLACKIKGLIAKKGWGKGYATEASNISLDFAFNKLNLDKIYSFTSVANIKSRAVMERIGMVNINKNFEHPNIPKGHILREHVLYRITQDEWQKI